MIRCLCIILFFPFIVVGIDFYVQNILSPVEYNGLEISAEVEEEPTNNTASAIEETKPLLPKIEEELKPEINCSLKKSEIEFLTYGKVKQKLNLELCDSILQISKKNRIGLRSRNAHKDYIKFDSKWIDPILDAYKEKIRLLKLNKIQAAEYIVASIQNIPYTLVHRYSHKKAENSNVYIKEGVPTAAANKYAKLIKRLHEDVKEFSPLEQPGGCLGGVNYGMVTPIEMFMEKMGDCDSRSTALYLVLKKLGYDVIELGSDLHQHALLGVNLPGGNHGNVYYPYKGRKYYIWETTAFHPKLTRLGVHEKGALYKSNWAAWEVLLQ